MSSESEDFPTPISPRRRMVYGAFAVFFEVLMIPFLRDSTSLGSTVRTDASKRLLRIYLAVRMLLSSLALGAFSLSTGAFPPGLTD